MFSATALGIFLIPVFYVVVRRIFQTRAGAGMKSSSAIGGPAGASGETI